MGIDFLDCCIRLEREFDLHLDGRKLDALRNARGTLTGATAAHLARWVDASILSCGREVPPDLWPRVRSCIAATISAHPDEVSATTRLIEDLGFT